MEGPSRRASFGGLAFLVRLLARVEARVGAARYGKWFENGLSFASTPSPSVGTLLLPLSRMPAHDPQVDVDDVVGQTPAVREPGGVAADHAERFGLSVGGRSRG